MPYQVTCRQCGATFEATRSDARYCGPACRQEAHRGVPPHTDRPRPRPEPDREPEPLHPDRRAWLAFDTTRCWFRLNWDPSAMDGLYHPAQMVAKAFEDPTVGAHAEAGMWWIAKRADAVERLRRDLARAGAQVIDTDYPGALPEVFFLELQSSPHPLERAIGELLRALPREQWRPLVRQLIACAHPDKPTAYRPKGADDLLEIAIALRDDPDLPKPKRHA